MVLEGIYMFILSICVWFIDKFDLYKLWKNHNKLSCLYIYKQDIQTEFWKNNNSKCINIKFVYTYHICILISEIYLQTGKRNIETKKTLTNETTTMKHH